MIVGKYNTQLQQKKEENSMAVKKGNKTIPITLPKYHQKKLKVICERTGISKSGVVQRLIEQHQIFVEADTRQQSPDGQT